MENKTYGFSRRIQLKNYIKSAHGFESAEFTVSGVENKEEAIEDVMDWIKKYVKEANDEANDKRTAEEKFNDSLDDTPPRETLSKEEDKKTIEKKLIGNKKKV